MSRISNYNPTPISKLLITILLAFSITANVNELFSTLIVCFITLYYALNNKVKTAIKSLAFYAVITFLFMNIGKIDYDFFQKYLLIISLTLKIFFMPIFAGKFLIDTSDVSSMIVSMEKMRFPSVIIIPIAVIFRYFPAFRDDKKNIKRAMKMRGISFKNPIKYLEYISVPMLISAINIADDISKAAETKCISDPCKKSRYFEVKFGVADILYVLGIVSLLTLGRLYA